MKTELKYLIAASIIGILFLLWWTIELTRALKEKDLKQINTYDYTYTPNKDSAPQINPESAIKRRLEL